MNGDGEEVLPAGERDVAAHPPGWQPPGWHDPDRVSAQRAADQIAEMVQLVCAAVVGDPGSLRVTHEVVGRRMAVQAEPSAADIGRVAGAHGAMFHAVSALCAQMGRRLGVHVHYQVKDAGDVHMDTRRGPPDAVGRPDWPREAMLGLAGRLCGHLFSLPVAVEERDGGERTFLTLRLAPGEPKLIPDLELSDSVSRVLHACGAMNGRRVYARLERGPR